MTRRRWIVVPVAALVLALAGWFGLRAVLDVGRHRAAVAGLLAETSGWRAETGPLSLALFPAAALGVDGVILADPRGRSRLEAPRAIVRARLGALAGRRLEAREIELLRPELRFGRQGGRLVVPPLGAVARVARGRAEGRLVELRIRGGRAIVPPAAFARQGTPELVLENLSAVFVPATGRLWGSARLRGGGQVRWLGYAGRRLEIRFDGLPADLIASHLGFAESVAGQVTGRVVRQAAGALEIDATCEGPEIPQGVRWPSSRLQAQVAPPGGEARPVEGTLHVAALEIGLAGTLGQARRLSFSVRQAPAEALLSLARPVLGPAVASSGPGTFDGSLDLVSGGADGHRSAWRWEGRGELRSVVPAPGLPALSQARIEARGASDAPTVLVASGRLAGGNAHLELESAGQGRFSWKGRLEQASFEQVLRALAPGAGAGGAIAGMLGARGSGSTGPGGIEPARLDVRVDRLELPGWDLLAPWVGALAAIEREAPPAVDEENQAVPPAAGPRSLSARVARRGGSLILEDVEIAATDASARGSGRFETGSGTISLSLVLTPEGAVRRWIERGLQAAGYEDPEGPITGHRLVIEGPFGLPDIRLDPEPMVPAPAPGESSPETPR